MRILWTKILISVWADISPSSEVGAVVRLGWNTNGELLTKAVEEGFEVLVTMDSNMVHQQNIGHHAIAVIALRAKSNRLDDTCPLMAPLLKLLPTAKRGTVTFVPGS